MANHSMSVGKNAWVLAALVGLLALTVLAYELPLGAADVAINLAIAVAKALLVVLLFMHVRWSSPMVRVFAGAGLFWLAILIALTLTDVLTRT